MEAVEFIIFSIWKLRNFFAGLDQNLIAFVIICFCLGFLLRGLSYKRLASDLREEIEELSTRLRGAEKLLSAEIYNFNESKELDTGYEALRCFESQSNGPNPRTFNDALLDQSYKQRESEHEPPQAQNHQPQRVVRLVMIFGENGGRSMNTPTTLIGLEERPPELGECYRVIQPSGLIFHTSIVTKVGVGYVWTKDAFVGIEELSLQRDR